MGQSARNASIGVNGFDLSTFLKSFSSAWSIDLEDTTTFAPTRTAKSWTQLLEETVLSLMGFWDGTATTGVHEVISDALGAADKAIVTVWPTGDAVGSPGYAIEADAGSRKIDAEVKGVIGIGCEFKSSVGEDDVVSLHALAQETADGNGTTVDFGAATTKGGAVYLEVADVDTDNAVTIRGSTDNFGASDVLLATFTTVVADRKVQRIAISGTVHRYIRVVWNLTGPSTFRASIARNP